MGESITVCKAAVQTTELLVSMTNLEVRMSRLGPKMARDFVVGIFIRNTILNMEWLLSTLNCQSLI